jgi:Xaa-Pro dipeptidase
MATPLDPARFAPQRAAELDELFSDLEDQRGSVQPIQPAERAARRARLGGLLAGAGLDALLVEPGATLRYLTGVDWGRSERLFGLVVTADGAHFWIAPAFERERAQKTTGAGTVVTWQEDEYAYAPLAAALRERRATRVAIDPDVRHRFVTGLAAELGAPHVLDGGPLVTALRGTKDAHELALLRRANELTQQSLRAVGARLADGTTGVELAEMVTWAQHRLGLRNVWNLSLIGPAAAFPHGDDQPTVVEPGAVVLVDTGGELHDYQSDNTRTWVQGGKPSERVATIWHAVRDAQRAAFDAIAPGALCRTVDEAARGVLGAAGFGPSYACFTHRLGHGIGTEGHEPPYLDGGSTHVLEPGMTFSNEPGVYLRGELGLRIEDIVVVTADGADHFGAWQASPASPD